MKRFMLGMLAAVMAISLVLIGVNSEAAKVPNVVKRPIGTAMRILNKAGLKARRSPVPTRKKALHGMVAAQSIRPGKSVRRGTWVALKVFRFAAKSARVKVPNVFKRPIGNAMRILNKAGLKGRQRNVPTKNKALNGKVAAQSINPGKSVPRGTWVALKVFRFAAKPARVKVPRVIKRPLGPAMSILRKAGLKSRPKGNVPTKNKALIGKVAGQSIRPGKSVPRGTWVNLKVFRFAAKPYIIDPAIGKLHRRNKSIAAKIKNARAAYLKARNNGRALCKRLWNLKKDKRAREKCARGFR